MGVIMEEIKKTIFKDIYNLINNIKKCSSTSQYTKFITELNTLFNMCDELGISDYPKLEDYSYKSIKLKNMGLDFYYNILINYQYHLDFSNNYKNIDENKYLYNNEIIKDCFDTDNYFYIIEDFLYEYDPDLLKIYYDTITSGRMLWVKPCRKEGEELYTPAYTTISYGSFKPYIIIKRENNVTDLINIVHELGHAKEYINAASISKKVLNQKEFNCLSEVYSYFLQNLFIKYLEKIHFYLNDIDTAKLGYNYTFYHWIKKLNEVLNDKNINPTIVEYLNYTYGIGISYHFIDRYIIDPEKTKKDIDEFVIFNGQYNFISILDKYNLKDEIIDSKILKKYI